MSVWYEGSTDLDCDFLTVVTDLEDPAAHFLAVTRAMPGITTVELTEQGQDRVTLETNEGTMTRSGIEVATADDQATIEFDEQYRTSRVTVASHHEYRFGAHGDGVTLQLTITDVDAGGVLGFAYRKFGGKNIGRGLLGAVKAHMDG